MSIQEISTEDIFIELDRRSGGYCLAAIRVEDREFASQMLYFAEGSSEWLEEAMFNIGMNVNSEEGNNK